MQFQRSQKPLLVSSVAIVAVAVWFATPFGRHITNGFLDSLRIDKPQTVNVNLAAFGGPNANQGLQQMVTQMIADNVTTTVNQSPQNETTATDASRVAGFPVEVMKARSDEPEITVDGEHAYTMTVDRARLQAILDEAGRKDLVVPSSVNGAPVTVRVPRAVVVRYGTCPGPTSAAANVATPTPSTTHYDNCVILREGPPLQINAPQNIDLSQLSEIGLELAGMTPDQAHQFLSQVDWKSLLGVSFPRFMRSYQTVQVHDVPATLLMLSGRQGPDYALFWKKNGIVYSLRGYGSPDDATRLAQSLQ